jgi:hypothetical protein
MSVPTGQLIATAGQSGAQMGIGLVDLMMNQMIMEQLKSINSTGGFTISTIITLVIIMSLTELKSSAAEFIKSTVSKIKEYIPYYCNVILDWIKYIICCIVTKCKNIWIWSWSWKVKTQSNSALRVMRNENESFSYTIEWNPKIQQALVFLEHIINDKNNSYQKDETCNISSDSYRIKYKNVKIVFPDFCIMFPDTNIEFKNGMIHSYESIRLTEGFDFGSKEHPTCLCSFIGNENEYGKKLKSFVRMAFIELQDKKYTNDEDYKMPFLYIDIKKSFYDPEIFLSSYSGYVKYNFEDIISFLLKYKYKSINVQIVFFELYLIIGGYICDRPTFYKDAIKKNCIHIDKLGIHIDLLKHDRYDDICKLELVEITEKVIIPNPDMYIKNNNNSNNKTFKMTILSSKKINYDKEFLNFLQDIWDKYEKSKDPNKKEKVSVFELKLKREYNETVKENPKYKEYMDNLSCISEKFPERPSNDTQTDKNIEKKEKNTQEQVMTLYQQPQPYMPYGTHHSYYHQPSAKDMLIERLGQIPQKNIVHTEEIVTVEQREINTVYKGLDTLYLRKEDKSYLQSIITRFNSCSDIYDDLDIPHKLGVLLHGEPGTGKSSTIKAIASYTKRDIYYVDLSNVKKNSELKMIFDHVNKGCIKGGILVFEDIDCMTDIVKPRKKNFSSSSSLGAEFETLESPKEQNILSVIKDEGEMLNLSYFLNLLDGTLSVDNLLFIMTTNHIENLDPALIRNGRIDVNIELKCCDRYQIASIYNKITKKALEPEILEKIPEYKYKPIDIITHVLKYYVSNRNEENIMDAFLM